MHRPERAPHIVRLALTAALAIVFAVIAPSAAHASLASFTGVGQPSVSGTGVVGTNFTASLDTTGVSPTPTGIDYEWYDASSGDLLQSGGTTYTAPSSLLGKNVYVVATLHAQYTTDYTTTNSPFSATIRLGSFTNVGQPSVSGSGLIGTNFTASFDTTGVTPSPTSIDYNWYQADGGELLQSGGTTYTATAGLLGKNVYVLATLHADNTSDYVTENSPFSATIHVGSFEPGASPRLSGQHTVGGTLTASIDTSGWAPVASAVAWQWYLQDGTALPGQTGATLALTDALVGQAVYATATLTAPNVQDYLISTPPSGKIASVTVTTDKPSTVVGGQTLVEIWGLLFSTDYELELHSTPVKLGTFTSGADGTLAATVSIPAGTTPGTHHIVVLRNGVEVGSVEIVVTAPPTALARTGADAAPLATTAAVGLATIVIGLVALLVIRRGARRHTV